MSLLIDRLAVWIEAQGEGTVGVDLFKVTRPHTPTACVSIHATGGYSPDRYTARERPTLLISARATTPAAAIHKAYKIYNLLHRQQNLDLGDGIWALTIQAIGSPGYVGSESLPGTNAHLASFNLAFDLRVSSS